MNGLHLTADLTDCHCAPHWLVDATALGAACLGAVEQAGLQAVGQLFHTFDATPHGPGGVTATVLLAESHLCVHTWPESRSVTLDVYVCNFNGNHSHRARALMDAMLALFAPTRVQRHALQRGSAEAPAHPYAPTQPPSQTDVPWPATHHGIQPYPAMLLAAGRGERMRPLTDTTPKPLLPVQGLPLLQWHLSALADAGVKQAVINTAWLGEQISAYFSAKNGGYRSSINNSLLFISYSHEGQDFGQALETAGGIARALPQLGPVFWLAAGDVFAPDFVFDGSAAHAFAYSDDLAHLWLVPNPTHNPQGDFGLSADGRALNTQANAACATPRYTYSTIALLKAALFTTPWCDIAPGNPNGQAAALAPLLRRAMDAGRVSASLYQGRWTDVGTPERLAQLNQG